MPAGKVVPTLSPSMDIQVASNFERYLYYRLGENALQTKTLMQEFEQTGSITLQGTDPTFAAGRGDTSATLGTIKKYFENHGTLLDPHGAVGVAVAEANPLPGCKTLCLETAHPGKFPAAVGQALGDGTLARHDSLEKLKCLPLRKTLLEPTVPVIESFILQTLADRP